MNGISDALLTNSEAIGRAWVKLVRKSGNLKIYNSLTDDTLQKNNGKVMRMLLLWFEKEADKNRIGAFFVDIGKNRRKEGYAVSEICYALFLAQHAVLEYISTNYINDSPIALYTTMNSSVQIADFFFLASYYMTKGYLEDTFIALNRDEAMPVDTLRKYFSDDFFFKDDNVKS